MADTKEHQPPKPSHAVSLVATGIVLTCWLGLTLASPWLAGPLGRFAAQVEVALGLDVLPGSSDSDSDDGNEEGA